MINGLQKFQFLALIATSLTCTGCASIDRMGAKMDMAVNRLSEEEDKPEFEGRLEAIKPMGAMTAIALTGGHYYDVVEVSPGLVHGDIIRIYHTEKGYVARLWKPIKQAPKISESIHPVDRTATGS